MFFSYQVRYANPTTFINPKTQFILKKLLTVLFSMAILICLSSTTVLGADSLVDSTADIVCVSGFDYAPSVEIAPYVSSAVFKSSETPLESPDLDPSVDNLTYVSEVPIESPDLDTSITPYGKTFFGKTKNKRNRRTAKRKHNRSMNRMAFPGASRSGRPSNRCAAYN